MSYNPALSGGDNAFCFLTGVTSAGNNNATPDTMEPGTTPWITLPPAATSAMSTTGAVLLRGVPSSSAVCQARFGDSITGTNNLYEQGNIFVIQNISTAGYGVERSDDEMALYRSSSAVIKIQALERLTSIAGPSWESSYARYFAFRMG